MRTTDGPSRHNGPSLETFESRLSSTPSPARRFNAVNQIQPQSTGFLHCIAIHARLRAGHSSHHWRPTTDRSSCRATWTHGSTRPDKCRPFSIGSCVHQAFNVNDHFSYAAVVSNGMTARTEAVFLVASSWHPRDDVTRMLYAENGRVEFKLYSCVDVTIIGVRPSMHGPVYIRESIHYMLRAR